ncbi:MAG TPA: S-ribosylhomocysteine lyase [Deinococcales bacterium]|nr:S-ribosylhomocysteine lyase [Deinococcales bacterium]
MKLESFDLDHTRVRAPYVRVAGRTVTPRGDVIAKYDLRVTQPNQEVLDTASLHTLEHLLATTIRDHLDGVLDLSPMGCRTGFYCLTLGEPEPERMLAAFGLALQDVVAWQGEVPGASVLTCGNAADHDLAGAQAAARAVLDAGLHVQETIGLGQA